MDASPTLSEAESHGAELERLLAELAEAEDEAAAAPIQTRVITLWSQSGSDAMDLLLKRGRDAMEGDKLETALAHLDALTRLSPDFAEGWNLRGTIHFLQEDYWSAMADVARTLAIEPRHFGALSGMGRMLEETGNEAGALAAYRAALAVNPALPGPKAGVERLAEKVDGREI